MSTQKPLVIATYGLPRSGKSTIIQRLSRNLGAPIVRRDDIRLALHGQRYEALAEPVVKAIADVMLRALVLSGHPIVLVDETNYSRAARDRMRSDKWDTMFLEVATPPEVCIERAHATGQPDLVPVIKEMWERREPLAEDEPRYSDMDMRVQLALVA